jgi:2-hydroxychromene-2-carboxylate isomerase
MPMIVVMAVDKHYFDRSGLSDEEKKQGRVALQRFARGVFDKKIDEKGIDSVMMHVADRQGQGNWELRAHVSDQDLRAALAAAKARADEAGIGESPQNVDPSDEMKRIIDESLQQASK